jgi:hypothetical protein
MNKIATFDDYVKCQYGNGVLSRDDIKKGIKTIEEIGFYKAQNLVGDSDPYYDACQKIMRLIKNRIDELCREPKQSIKEKKSLSLQVLSLPMICPKCGSHQFSISVPDIRPADWPQNILGSADCRGCQQDFLVKLAPELERAVYFLLRSNRIDHVETMKALKVMFPNS